jgi:Mn-dependent DtxR family transcriptional regulator
MSTLERWLLLQIKDLYRRSRRPVRTIVLADMLGMHDRTVRKMLARMECRGVVQRRGQRGGWMPNVA